MYVVMLWVDILLRILHVLQVDMVLRILYLGCFKVVGSYCTEDIFGVYCVISVVGIFNASLSIDIVL